MMEQYFAIKADYPEMLLFYRMGDFYEMFFEDAVVGSKIMDVALTHRGTDSNGQPIPMAGVPYHSYEPYLQKLIFAGFRVAIAEQMETPEQAKSRGNKAVVERKVLRVITPGTVADEALLQAADHSFLMALIQDEKETIASWADLSTGHFFCETIQGGALEILDRVRPKELLVSEDLKNISDIQKEFSSICITVLPDSRFKSSNLEQRLRENQKVDSIESLGTFSKLEIKCAGLVSDYVSMATKARETPLKKLVRLTPEEDLWIDVASRRSLELTQSATGDKNTTLFSVMNLTKTAAGKRLFTRFFENPLRKKERLETRLDAVDFFVKNTETRDELRKNLSSVPDIERILSRITLNRATPRDLGQIKDFLSELPKFVRSLTETRFNLFEESNKLSGLVSTLKKALRDELPFLARTGNLIREGFYPPLDDMRILAENGQSIMNQLRDKYAHQSGIQNLKIKNNNMVGYYLEVHSKNSAFFLDPKNGFIHRQTMADALRLTTQELIETEHKLKGAQDKSIAMEVELFEKLCLETLEKKDALQKTADILSEIDVFTALAELATNENYTRPTLTEGLDFEIKGGRHPVVERFLPSRTFVENDCILENKDTKTTRLWIITGPNMAGKSTFLRQTALIAFMAQIGSFVPAESATIGLVDKIFSRVGASDNLAKGHSTFMTEMIETASILNQATPRSLVILDEVGRGTATFDGLSIAWAVVEHLHTVNQSRGLFATHYHELTALAEDLPFVSCHTSTVKEWKNEIIFMHKIKEGSADKSYGIHVAKLAGLPLEVLRRAQEVLTGLEKQDRRHPLDYKNDLFHHAVSEHIETDTRLEKLDALNIDTLSPKEALDFLYELRKKG